MFRHQSQYLQVIVNWILGKICLAVSGLYWNPFFGNLSIYAVYIWKKSVVLSKYALKKNAPAIVVWQQRWQYQESCICHHVQLYIWLLRHLPCLLQSQVSKTLLHHWRTLCQSKISVSTYELSYKIPFRPINLPQFSESLHFRMTEIYGNFSYKL